MKRTRSACRPEDEHQYPCVPARPLPKPTGCWELFGEHTIKFLDEETLLCLYKGLVRPSLEYGVIIWSPYLKKDQDAVEAVQRGATRLVPGLQELPYEERLWRLQLPTLTYRRSRGGHDSGVQLSTSTGCTRYTE